MKLLALVIPLALLVAATPALAKTTKKLQRTPQQAMAKHDPYAVYVAGTYVGRDPDPAVRASMIREFGRRR